MWEKISRYYPPWLDVFCIAYLGFIWVYTSARYGLMPEQIPTHFGPTGAPDAWSARSFGSVYMLLIIGTLVYLSMFLINYFLIIKPKDPRKFINLPQARKDAMNDAQMEAIRRVTVQGMAWLDVTLVIMFAVIQYGMVNTALGIQKGVGPAALILAGVLLVEAGWLTYKTLALSKPRA